MGNSTPAKLKNCIWSPSRLKEDEDAFETDKKFTKSFSEITN